MVSVRSLWQAFRHPVHPENRRNLAGKWHGLRPEYRTGQQMYGRHGEGCGATIGAMPKCDFTCTGCYLGEDANSIPAEPVEGIKRQMRLLRPWLGRWGNLQLTDGEVTLRPDSELVDLIRYCRQMELIPMLMTHGDTFRRRPGMLERLVVEGGLEEVSLHVDTTQRGRRGAAWGQATTEEELNPLRDEFAEMIRLVRRKTGKRLRGATTLTITPGNLDGVPAVMRWAKRNADAFSLISFQPVAQVGRTEDGLGDSVTVESLWERISEGLFGDRAQVEALRQGEMWFGHPGCNRYVPGLVVKGEAGAGFLPVRLLDDPVNGRISRAFLDRWGGLTFRPDSRGEAVARVLGVLSQSPWLVARNLIPYVRHWLRRLGGLRTLGRALAGRVKLNGLMVMSHHFMSRQQIETPTGRARLQACVFQVPHGDRMISMCEANALGLRDRYYEGLRDGRPPGIVPREPETVVPLQEV